MAEKSDGASSAVLYRKYRPASFKDVLGQEHIVSVLEGSIKQGNISHAYLFSGSRGTGKTSLARILAKNLKVSDKDLYEIDAASNRGIDDIRELRDGVGTLPFDSPYKVYIIDEVHMLTKEAFNALLKTLEEPPKHALFILATTELEKLPETVISRCQTFTFKKPSQRILKEMVTNVAKSEGYTLEPGAANLIALLAEGSFRDAHGVLQKIIFSTSDKKVTATEVEAVTDAPPQQKVHECILAIEEGNLGALLEILNATAAGGADMKIFAKLLLHAIRLILLLRFARELEDDIRENLTDEDFDFLKRVSAKRDSRINAKLLKTLLGAYSDMGYAHIAQLPLELAFIKTLEDIA